MNRIIRDFRAVVLIAGDTFGELRRHRATLAVGIVAIFAVGGGGWWREFNFGTEQGRFLLDFGWGVQGLVAASFAIVATAQVLLRAFEQGTAAVALARPLSPATWLAGQALGVLGWVTAYVILSTLWLAGTLQLHGLAVPIADLTAAATLLVLKQAVVIGVAGWFATYGRSLVFVVMAACLVVGLGQLRFLMHDDGGVSGWIVRLVPQMRLFDLASWHESGGLNGSRWVGIVAYAGGFVVVLWGMATWSLKRREF
ncbi:hypothetical protein [Synoicihabitans lomoniglobus]|uniref:Uncharacterized protein n=1 Tax=Synoicihabitans lomoniglobus TaxID=2909285 RepID=A0AAF0CSH3_9BACT|nr:hypothetical protein [Opitutaceae bacterium LMO-M01]WED67191.1 hypothetical protein PXH66_10035 [Opitutaceae bacterium LMO-M01]